MSAALSDWSASALRLTLGTSASRVSFLFGRDVFFFGASSKKACACFFGAELPNKKHVTIISQGHARKKISHDNFARVHEIEPKKHTRYQVPRSRQGENNRKAVKLARCRRAKALNRREIKKSARRRRAKAKNRRKCAPQARRR